MNVMTNIDENFKYVWGEKSTSKHNIKSLENGDNHEKDNKGVV